MSLTQEQIETIIALWKYSEHQADPRSKEELITSGLQEKPLLSCQYWIKGLGTVCSYWNGTKCSYEITPGNYPSGYNGGNCDYLGRRNTCDKYNGTVDNENYTCVAPNIFLSGLGKIAGKTDTGYLYSAVPKEDIWGYCKGNCDGQGMGTGCNGTPGVSPVVCNYYRPWQMGFGSLEPRQIRHTYKDGLIVIETADIEAALDDVFNPMVKRLPFAFDVYNLRAQFQKCAHWNEDYGSFFNMDKTFGYISSDVELESLCTCGDIKSKPYCTLKNPVGEGVNKDWLLQDVWSEANTVICNGAKPECPCYTGEWKYCNDSHMYTGARITANLVFELRFWADYWENQSEYDAYFRKRPNLQDTPTPHIYTFTRWQRLGETATDSVAEGRVLSLNIGSAAGDENKRFYPEVYVQSNEIQYSSAGINIGTTAPDAEQLYYPSLIRNIDGEFDTDIQDGCLLQIVYPYTSDDPFSDEKVNLSSFICTKIGSSITEDTVSVVGYSIRDKRIYAFNLNKLDSTLMEFEGHRDVSTLSQIRTPDEDGNVTGLSPREKFNSKIEDFIRSNQKTNVDDIASTTTNSHGYFNLGPLELDYYTINTIIVCIEYFPGLWDFRIRNVESIWLGGVIVQTSFDFDGNGDSLPMALVPTATIEGKVIKSPKCSLGEIIHSYSYLYENHLHEVHLVTSYCYIRVDREFISGQWKRIGNIGYIWCELDDVNINNIFRWNMLGGKMTYIGGETDEPITVSMEVVDLREAFISGQNPFPPSACVLKIKEGEAIPPEIPQVFWKEDWELSVEFWYTKISNSFEVEEEEEGEEESETILWPDIDSRFVHLREGVLSISTSEGTTFTVKDICDDTVSLFATFTYEDRIVNTMATKMLIQIAQVSCRNVEIFYRYQGQSRQYKLTPDTGGGTFRENGSIESDGDGPVHRYAPLCGDHENGWGGCIDHGPMWFPYNECKFCDFYRSWGVAGYCTAWFKCAGHPQGSDSNMLRYCGPPLNKAWAIGNPSLAYCHTGFKYRYSTMDSDSTIFTGYANIVHWVDIYNYYLNQWDLPPFGLKGRDMVLKYLSQDYIIHITHKGGKASTTSKWVPVVPTLDDFLMPLGSFDEVSVINNNGIFHTSQLNFFECVSILECIGDEINNRYRFEDVFGTRRMFAVSYPRPDPYSIQYYFKGEDVVWAWQEYWKEIEQVYKNLYFVNYRRPEYKYDVLKMEHRYICAEGNRSIIFRAPKTVEGVLTSYPSISLEGGPARYFEIIYDTYEGTVEWMDEGDGTVGGSSQDTEEGGKKKNFYEETLPNVIDSKWNHDENCIFDSEACSTYELAEAAGRKFVASVSEDEDGGVNEVGYYYNRGIIVDMKREDLCFLPCTEYDFDLSWNWQSSTSSNSYGMGTLNYRDIQASFVYNTYDLKKEKTLNEMEKVLCVSEVKITGLWGLNKVDNVIKYEVCIPAIEIIEVYDNSELNTLVSKESVAYDAAAYGDGMGLNSYEFVFKLQVTPKRMFLKNFYNAVTLEINLSPSSDQFIYLNTIEFKVSTYTSSSETIKVYERKYVTSTSDKLGPWNINGPKVPSTDQFVLQHDLDLDNSGTYYAISPEITFVPPEEFETMDKMRAGYASEQYFEKEKIDINMGNLITVESKQEEVYENARNRDTEGGQTHYSMIEPVYFRHFGHGLDFSGTLFFNSVVPTWDDLAFSSAYREGGAPWNPGGHFWEWSDLVERASCYTIIPEYFANYFWYGDPDISILGLHNLQDVYYRHVDRGSSVFTSNVAEAFVTNRFSYKMDLAEKLIQLNLQSDVRDYGY